jgi:hypothetical protein
VKRCTTALVDISHRNALILVLFFSVSDIELYTLYLSSIQSRLHSCLPLLAKNVGCMYDSLFSRSRLQSSLSRWISASTSADGGLYVSELNVRELNVTKTAQMELRYVRVGGRSKYLNQRWSLFRLVSSLLFADITYFASSSGAS